MQPRTAIFTTALLAASSAAVSHVYVRTPAATLTLNPVGVLASFMLTAAVGFAAFALWRSRPRAVTAALVVHVLGWVAFMLALFLVPEDSAAWPFTGYGLSVGGWIAALLMWGFSGPWLVFCALGIAPCP